MTRKIAITFDLDFADYVGGGIVEDELEQCWPVFTELCNEIGELKTTWFIRIDNHIGEMFGEPDFIFRKHASKIDWLKANGHEVAWHFHSYRKKGGKWKQNPDEKDVLVELAEVFPLVKAQGLEMLRMGWAYHTNLTFSTIASLGIKTDCSAMPRPAYAWEKTLRDWTTTPHQPYYPSKGDYRIPGIENHGVLELPIFTIPVGAPYDTETGILRYLNPAYHNSIFQKAIRDSQEEILNTLSHPYEFLPSSNTHGMLAFSSQVFSDNIRFLKQNHFSFITMTEWKNLYLSTPNPIK